MVDQHGQVVKPDDSAERCQEFFDACLKSATMDSCRQCGKKHRKGFDATCKIDSLCKQLMIDNQNLSEKARQKMQEHRGSKQSTSDNVS